MNETPVWCRIPVFSQLALFCPAHSTPGFRTFLHAATLVADNAGATVHLASYDAFCILFSIKLISYGSLESIHEGDPLFPFPLCPLDLPAPSILSCLPASCMHCPSRINHFHSIFSKLEICREQFSLSRKLMLQIV